MVSFGGGGGVEGIVGAELRDFYTLHTYNNDFFPLTVNLPFCGAPSLAVIHLNETWIISIFISIFILATEFCTSWGKKTMVCLG